MKIKFFFLLLILILNEVQAQPKIVTLDEAIQLALQNYPVLKVADLKIKQQESLINTGFELPKTHFYYQGQALGYANDNDQHDFGVSQGFSLPKVYQAKNDLLAAQTEVVRAEKTLTEIEVRNAVATTFWAVVATQGFAALYAKYDTVYSDFLQLARLRFQTGEVDKIEVLSIEADRKSLNNKALQAQQTLKRQLLTLSTLTATANLSIASDVSFEALPLPAELPNWTSHPLLRYWKSQIQVADNQVVMEELKLLPDFQIAYASQIFNGQAGLNGVQLTVAIPLQKQPQRHRIEAARTEIAIATAQAESESYRLQMAWNQYLQSTEAAQLQMDFHKNQRLILEENLTLAKLKYEAGEASYLEYLVVIQRFILNEEGYWQALQKFNDNVVRLKYEIAASSN